jgi:hypothetical protein
MDSYTYSFMDVLATLVGPTGSINLGAGAGVSDEGITVDMLDDKGSMLIGADGTPMHSLHGGKAATILVRLLKTSPTNAILSAAYNAQAASSALWGQNLITVRNPIAGDLCILRSCAFRRQPALNYPKAATMNEWSFNCGRADMLLGSGSPEAQQQG